MSAITLSAGERRRVLDLLHRTHDAPLYRCTFAVLERSHGKSVEEIAELLQVSRESVYS